MSTNSECLIVETSPGAWYYVLESRNAPDAWDWREFAHAYGPFPSEDEAHTHLGDNHPNPGGYSVELYVAGSAPDETMAALIKDAEAPSNRGFGGRW